MPRTSRKRSETGFYHVILRGNGKQNLFETDKDRAAFMEAARSSFSRDSVTLIAWCLMDNHVHLIIDDPLDRISTAIQRVASTYAMYFNHTFGHSGHVFEGRYGSVPIIDDEQLLAAVKYVHNNPLKGMGSRLIATRGAAIQSMHPAYRDSQISTRFSSYLVGPRRL